MKYKIGAFGEESIESIDNDPNIMLNLSYKKIKEFNQDLIKEIE